MNAKKFSENMSAFDGKYVDEATNYKKKLRKSILGKLGLVLICFAVVAILGVSAYQSGLFTTILSAYGNNKNGMETLENVQNDSSLIQESVSLSQDKEESEDVNLAVKDETENQKTTVENTENTRNFNTNDTLSSIVQNDVSKIIVTNGSTGEKREIDDIEEINNLLEQIKELEIISQEEKNVQGYSYSMALYANENLAQNVYVNDGIIVIDGIEYTVESSQNIIDSVR